MLIQEATPPPSLSLSAVRKHDGGRGELEGDGFRWGEGAGDCAIDPSLLLPLRLAAYTGANMFFKRAQRDKPEISALPHDVRLHTGLVTAALCAAHISIDRESEKREKLKNIYLCGLVELVNIIMLSSWSKLSSKCS